MASGSTCGGYLNNSLQGLEGGIIRRVSLAGARKQMSMPPNLLIPLRRIYVESIVPGNIRGRGSAAENQQNLPPTPRTIFA